jgi:hypothetical protein
MHEDYPQLVSFYISATKKVFGHGIRVSERNYSMFRVLEDDLRDIGADSREYAYTVMTMLKTWAKEHNMNFVPVKVFCGEFAYKKFLKVWKSETVVIEDSDDFKLLYAERMVAEAFITDNMAGANRTFEQEVEDLRPMLSKEWLEMFDSGKYRKYTGEIIDELCRKYKVVYARDYSTLLRLINQQIVFNKITDDKPIRIR